MELWNSIAASEDEVDRRAVAHDLWPRRLLEKRQREPMVMPARVLWPADDAELVQIVRSAREQNVPLVPFGAGSGVCGGISPRPQAWVVDMKRMARLVHVDEERGLCTVEAGMIGERLERLLNARGLSLGHFPSSIYCSTVGGWVATRSAGQLSSRYGKIEDLVVAIEGVDGRGHRIRARLDDPETGPAMLRLLIGSEGAFCIVTRVMLRVHRLASHRWLRGFTFSQLESALAGAQMLMTSGEAPSVLRVYDPLDTRLSGGVPAPSMEPDRIVAGAISQAGLEDSGPEGQEEEGLLDRLVAHVEDLALFQRPRATRRLVGELMGRPAMANSLLDRISSGSKMVIGLEGDAETLGARLAGLRTRLQALGAHDAGDAPGARWLLHRHRVSYRMARAFAAGGWVDTFEVATGWSDVLPMYHAVRDAVRDVAVVMCHFSHAYRDGCSLYFTFVGGGAAGRGPRSALGRYDLAWDRALSTVRRMGGALSHHHGIGRSKAAALRLPEGNLRALMAWKAILDPSGILNPGVLGLWSSQ